MSAYGGWRTATIANGAATSDEVDLGRDFEFLDIILPTLTSCTIKIQVAKVGSGTYQDLGSSITTGTTTGAYSTTFKLGGWQNIKVVSSVNQGAAKSIEVRGWRF